MKMTVKGGLATLALVTGVLLAGAASAETYDRYQFGPSEGYVMQHCTYNPCNIDYSDRAMPAGPYNPYKPYRYPSIEVYENPYYPDEGYAPPPPPDEEYPYEEYPY